MLQLSQNQRIATSAVIIFILSFVFMLVFLNGQNSGSEDGHTSVLDADGKSHEKVEAEYRKVIGDTEQPIFTTDSEGVFTYASEDFCDLIEMRCEDLEEQKFVDFVNAKQHSEFVSAYSKLVQEDKRLDAIGPFKMSNGKIEKLILFSAEPIYKDKKPSEIVFSAKDLTDKVEELKNEDNSWVDKLYPKIREMRNDDEMRLMVEKISYNKK